MAAQLSFYQECGANTYTANEVPHPQVEEALGLVKVNPRLLSPPW